MKKAYIIHENDEWIAPLRTHLHNLQVPFEEWHMDRVVMNFESSNREYFIPYERLFHRNLVGIS